ncbi:thioredoxin-disulfide reductase [Candidatus Saccharibacteria bacterium]|nr:thioredoxin-disulfide reductase [Candidatus Saccharibacteria bacterium]MCB9834811.1 thioredoxin-disulfide reductase [Candidatus Nomurabacteria bacterium]
MGKKYDLIILGSGPAGLTAAIYATRAKLNTLVLAGENPGGQLITTSEVENFPGFSQGIMGPELMQSMEDQAKRFGAEIAPEQADQVDFTGEQKLIGTRENHYQSRAVIIATGARAKWLGIDSEQKFQGKGLSACATCDGFFFTDKKVAVVGGGDSAMEEALTLTKYASSVDLIHRKAEFSASKIMQERVLTNPKIKIHWNSSVGEILGEEFISALRLVDPDSGKQSQILEVDGLFIAIGHQPATEVLRGQLELDSLGYIVTKNQVFSSIKGVFAAGDVVDRRYRQAITAAGQGCMAALEVERYLANEA